jgi:hypothetical protein
LESFDRLTFPKYKENFYMKHSVPTENQTENAYRMPIQLGLDLTDNFLNFTFKKCFTFSALFVEAAKVYGLNPKRIRKGKDSATEAIVTILDCAIADAPRDDWAQRLANTVAEVLNDEERSRISHTELIDNVLDCITDFGNDENALARVMLPQALRNAFKDAPPKLALHLVPPPGTTLNPSLSNVLMRAEGNISQRFKEIVLEIDNIAKRHEALASIPEETIYEESFSVQLVLVGEDGERLPLYQRPIIKGAMDELFDYMLKKDPLPEEPSRTAKEQAAHDAEASSQDPVLSGDEIFVQALTEIATDPQTPKEITLKLAAIISQLRETDNPQDEAMKEVR